MFRIIPFQLKCRDDAIFCVLSAKDALGRIPSINEDMLDIKKNYLDNNDMFWVALDDNNRVVGTIGTKTVSPSDMWLKRLFVKPLLKRSGIGSLLLSTAENYDRSKGVIVIHTSFSDDNYEASVFYPEKGFVES